MVKRALWHLLMAKPLLREHFPQSVIEQLTSATREMEEVTSGEVRICIEGGLDLGELLAGLTPRERASQLFSDLRIWDTEHNNGVLIYLLLAERDVEIVADRGISKLVDPAEWEQICNMMTKEFGKESFVEGLVIGLKEIAELMKRVLPETTASARARNELVDLPVVMI